MKRRDTFKMIPLSLAGIGHIYNNALAQCPQCAKPQNIAVGELCPVSYIDKCKDMLSWVRSTQSENILEAAYTVARSIEKGRTCWSSWDQGHTNRAEVFPDRNGDPGFLTVGYDPQKSRDGDSILISYPFSMDNLESIKSKDITIIAASSPVNGDCIDAELNNPGNMLERWQPHADIWIDTQVTSIGAVVKVPGSSAPLGPVTGPLYITIMWMIIADACRALALKGKKFKVKGDEPALSGDRVPWVNLRTPLMDDYFDTALRQMDMIGSELGEMQAIASMAVDSLLSGKSVYFYSRYREAFCSEATGRRGGFKFAKGASDGDVKGEPGDTVIMGISKPDDENDLANLDEFRKRGMKIACIGPMTRNNVEPEGRTVPKEAEAHIGKNMDTYGLFAIPGFDQKVCPTSGAVNVTALWSMSVEIAKQILQKTGNAPGIHYSGALRWGSDYNNNINAMFLKRGY